jgi:hypothetical protein
MHRTPSGTVPAFGLHTGAMQRRRLVAPALALLAAAAAVFLPIQHTVVSQSGPGPLETLMLETGYRSLLQTEGSSILLAALAAIMVARGSSTATPAE